MNISTLDESKHLNSPKIKVHKSQNLILLTRITILKYLAWPLLHAWDSFNEDTVHKRLLNENKVHACKLYDIGWLKHIWEDHNFNKRVQERRSSKLRVRYYHNRPKWPKRSQKLISWEQHIVDISWKPLLANYEALKPDLRYFNPSKHISSRSLTWSISLFLRTFWGFSSLEHPCLAM